MTSMNIGRSAIAAAALLLAAGGTVGCSKAESVSCSTGIYCPAGTQCAARQKVCILDNCGNGIVDPGEACDDGGIEDGDEIDGKHCSADCTSDESCGNRIVDEAVDEVCDDGNNVDGDLCSADCKSTEGCGNRIVDLEEDCDGGLGEAPGMALETEFCNTNCTWSRCGDGIWNATAEEECDRNGDGVPGSSGQSANCNVNCTHSVCGDEFINAAAGEECDRGPGGNSDTGDCLAVNCHVNVCGDGFQNLTVVNGRPKEECDAGDANSDTGACLTTCRIAKCGDGYVQAGVEGCDAGADSATEKTACPYGQSTCTLCSGCQWVNLQGPYCGDEITQPNETCDNGTANGATSCNYSTTSNTCDTCSSNCSTVTTRPAPHCGDGVVQAGFEVCDDGNNTTENRDVDHCDYGQATCTFCRSDCQEILINFTGPYCGDGQVHDNEACDNGAENGATSCNYSTTSDTCDTCSSNCSTATTRDAPHCGDGVAQAGFEVCDDGNNLTEDPDDEHCDYGQATCTFCRADCGEILADFTGPYCGDFVKDELYGERCDSVASFYCGTCVFPGETNACRVITSMAAATGEITVVSNDLLGVTFTLNDDHRKVEGIAFEFVNGDAPQLGNVAVSIAGATAGTNADAEAIAKSIEEAIEGSGLLIEATVTEGTKVVQLRNTVIGVIGNALITIEPPDTAALTATGMASGRGCVLGQSCELNSDCVPNSSDSSGHCGKYSKQCKP